MDQIVRFLVRTSGVDAACAMDYYYTFYDTFVTRDMLDKSASGIFPYFRHPESAQSIISHQLVKVKSCWNGVVVLSASVFYSDVEFRSIPGNRMALGFELSECCLLFADIMRLGMDDFYIDPDFRVIKSTFILGLNFMVELIPLPPSNFYRLILSRECVAEERGFYSFGCDHSPCCSLNFAIVRYVNITIIIIEAIFLIQMGIRLRILGGCGGTQIQLAGGSTGHF